MGPSDKCNEPEEVWNAVSACIRDAFFSINLLEESREALQRNERPEAALANPSLMYRRRTELIGRLYALLRTLEKAGRDHDVAALKELMDMLIAQDVVNDKEEQRAVEDKCTQLNPYNQRTA